MVQMRYVNKGVSNCKVDSDVIAKMDIDLEVIIYHVKVRKYMLCVGNSDRAWRGQPPVKSKILVTLQHTLMLLIF